MAVSIALLSLDYTMCDFNIILDLEDEINWLSIEEYTSNPYRQGLRINSLDSIETNGDLLLEKLKAQAKHYDIKANYLSKQWTGTGLDLDVQEQNRVAEAGRRAANIPTVANETRLSDMGYRMSLDNKRVCRNTTAELDGRVTYNTVRASSNLIGLVKGV